MCNVIYNSYEDNGIVVAVVTLAYNVDMLF